MVARYRMVDCRFVYGVLAWNKELKIVSKSLGGGFDDATDVV
jgi:hypothetical protein